MSAKHARRTRRRLPPQATVLILAGALPLSLHATTHALADAPVVTTSVLPTTTSDVGQLRSAASSVQELTRTAREIAQQVQRERRDERLEERRLRELRQERQERARERATRAERRAFEQWVMPVASSGWSASFGESGSTWSSGYHTGQDFTAPTGTPVVAASGGTITFAGWSDAYGNKIEVTHGDSNQTWYAHLDALERTSGSVEPGEVIGYVGCTGNCSGSHLHFEFHPGGGEASDPVVWLRDHGAL